MDYLNTNKSPLISPSDCNNKTICLNMIVKNESHIIKKTLQNIISKIHIDYWVISDTGSTDDTIEIIYTFFNELNIKGELYNDEWKDFGHNRTLALENAYKKTDYVFIFDADDEIKGELILPDIMDQDSYKLIFGNMNGFSYERVLLVNNHLKWKYMGVLHEYIMCCEQSKPSVSLLGRYGIVSGRAGNRNLDPDKYLKDAVILSKAYEEEVVNKGELISRYAFYCANSYFDCNKYELAAEWYKKVLTLNGWNQEKYVSCFKLYKCYKRINQLDTSFFYLVKSYYYDTERVECIYKLIVHYCCENKNDIAQTYYTLIQNSYETTFMTYNSYNKLFVDNKISNFFLPYYMIIVSEKTKNLKTGIKMYEIIFSKRTEGVSQWHIGNVLYNFQFFCCYINDDIKTNTSYYSYFYLLFNSYIEFLLEKKYQLIQYEVLKQYLHYDIPVIKTIFK
jgi:hypothetical protein